MSNGNYDTRGDTLEKDFSHNHLDGNHDTDGALHKIRTAGSISISPELFEKIYLSPQNQVKGELRKTFANPTPLALVGFLLSLTPLCMDLMNLRGTQVGDGSAHIGAYFWFGGGLMIIGAIGEFIVGNTFPMVVFGSFGAFWGFYGCTLVPFYSAFGNYAPYDKATPAMTPTAGSGLNAPEFNNSIGFFMLWMGCLSLIYLICALRTNLVFVMIFFTLVPAFSLLCAGFWYLAKADTTRGSTLIKAGGAFAFVTCLCGWWIFFAILLAALDFPFQLPVFDLSTIIKGASSKA